MGPSHQKLDNSHIDDNRFVTKLKGKTNEFCKESEKLNDAMCRWELLFFMLELFDLLTKVSNDKPD